MKKSANLLVLADKNCLVLIKYKSVFLHKGENMENKTIRRILYVFVAVAFLTFVGIYLFGVLPKQRDHNDKLNAIAQYYNDKVSAFTEENKTASNIDVVFLGDSLTEGYDLSTYYPQFKTLNRGIGGDTTLGLEKRLKVSVYDVQPKVAVMLIGGNNIYNMFDNYEQILQGFRTNIPNTKIVLLSLSPMGNDYAKKNPTATYNNARIKALALKYGYTFIDIFTPLFDVETNEIYKSFTVEGLHFTAQGYETITRTVTPVITELLND